MPKRAETGNSRMPKVEGRERRIREERRGPRGESVNKSEYESANVILNESVNESENKRANKKFESECERECKHDVKRECEREYA